MTRAIGVGSTGDNKQWHQRTIRAMRLVKKIGNWSIEKGERRRR
uniref:Uncharacterized protein n=1 Tax=Manihot esculenta TaxID=3983 RepID=A0A2C9UA88_MANES